MYIYVFMDLQLQMYILLVQMHPGYQRVGQGWSFHLLKLRDSGSHAPDDFTVGGHELPDNDKARACLLTGSPLRT